MKTNSFLPTLKRYTHVWLLFGRASLQIAFVNRGTIIFFFLGKFLRYAMMLLLLFTLSTAIKQIGPYTVPQLAIFFLVYQTIDTVSQMIFRGVYEFGEKIKSGDFDFDLCQPLNPLFRALFGRPDINDLLFVIPTLIINVLIASRLPIQFSIGNVSMFALLLVNSFLIAGAFHILVLALGIIIVEIDNTVMIYRDFSRLAQIPVSLYPRLIQIGLFTVLPVGLMMTVPAEVVLGLPSTVGIITTLLLGIFSLSASILIWRVALKRYTSASS